MSKLTDEQIKAAYTGRFGTVVGWLDLPGSYFLAGFRCAHAKTEGQAVSDGSGASPPGSTKGSSAGLASDAQDARRYRWLRAPREITFPATAFPTPPWAVRIERLYDMPTTKACHGDALDAALDAAMKGEQP